MYFSLSVIIPVFNAEKYIKKAILSILAQDEVDEIIVINDGSKDSTEEIVRDLKREHTIIKYLEHSNKINKGRSASRNLGILNSEGDLIAFLDADDFFLENRFKNDFAIFKSNSDCDGVYNAVGFHYYENSLKSKENSDELYTVQKNVNPCDLFDGLLNGKFGHFQIDGLTVKRSLFEKTGLFNECLVVAEDTDIFWKMTLKGTLITGVIDKAVAMRGVHDTNVFYQEDVYSRERYGVYDSILSWCFSNKISVSTVDNILRRVWIIKHSEQATLDEEFVFWLNHCVKYPRMIFSYLSLKYFPLVRRRKSLFSFFYKK